MTNERAIELLNRISDSQFDGIHGDERREALEMAIRAMEEPKTAGSGSVDSEQPEIKTDRTTGDSINRQQAIEAVRNAEYRFRIKSDSYFKDYVEEVREIAKQITDAHAKALEDLPPAERARFWIDSEGKISALPSGQIATDTNVGDTISRQQAIEGLYDVFFDDELNAAYPDKADVVLDVIRKLPTVQPEVLDCGSGELVKDSQRLVEASSNDMISRQQAIDEVINLWADKPFGNPTLIEIKGCIEALPSAQPERQVKLDGTESNIEILSELRAQFNCFDEVEEPCYRALSDAICALSAQPERKKGKWINHRKDDGHNIADCDQCGNAIQWFDGDEIPRYCCMCGADMRTEGNDDN